MRSGNARLRSLSGILFAAGIILIAAYNWRLWPPAESHGAGRQKSPAKVQFSFRDDRPKVSALVAAWNEADVIERHIESFKNLRYANKELVLCAGGRDETFELACKHVGPDVRVLLQQPGEGKQRSLARAFEASTGRILYFTDADCLFTDSAFESVLAPILSKQEHAATGASCPLPEQRETLLPVHLWARDLAASSKGSCHTEGLLGRNAAVTRDALVTAGGLNFDAPTGTDYHLAKRLLSSGTAIRFVPDSVIPSRYPDSFAEYRKRQSRWLRNLLLFGEQYGARSDVKATVQTLGLALAMTSLPLLALVLGRVPFLLWFLLLLHSVLARVRYMTLLDRAEPGATPQGYALAVVPLTFLDYLVTALPLIDLVSKRRRERW
jgi:cellulose synthase/poly-beta-1,6-N-acetylglucosamine synthase-like glycosyltransferase